MITKKPIKSFLNRLVVHGVKIPVLKVGDYINDNYYPFEKPQYAEVLSWGQIEAEIATELMHFTQRLDPEGVFVYAWDIKTLVETKGVGKIKDLGDLCLFHGLAMAVAALGKQEQLLARLLTAAELFMPHGYLLRGFSNWDAPNGQWEKHKTSYHKTDVSGDQAGGIIFGLSVAYSYYPELFSESLIAKISLLVHTTLKNDMRLLNENGGTNQPPEYAFHSFFEQDGSAVVKLALLSLGHKVTNEAEFSHAFFHLLSAYRFDLLATYSSAFLLRWNNYFGTHICSLALASICLNIPQQFALQGLQRIVKQTETWGHAFYALLCRHSEEKLAGSVQWTRPMVGNKLHYSDVQFFPQQAQRSLSSYYIAQESFDASKHGKRNRALSKRMRPCEDYFIQRHPFEDKTNADEKIDRWNLQVYTRIDTLMEWFLFGRLYSPLR